MSLVGGKFGLRGRGLLDWSVPSPLATPARDTADIAAELDTPTDRSTLILHGLGGSGPEHWQTWLAERLRARKDSVVYPDLPDPDAPSLERWIEAAGAALESAGPGAIVLCHSLASLLWMHLARRSEQALAAHVLLVAPPSATGLPSEAAEFVPVPIDPPSIAGAARETRIACAPPGEDPYCPEGARPLYGAPLGIAVDEIPSGGHLNADAGYGAWPAVEGWCLDPARVPITGRPDRLRARG